MIYKLKIKPFRFFPLKRKVITINKKWHWWSFGVAYKKEEHPEKFALIHLVSVHFFNKVIGYRWSETL